MLASLSGTGQHNQSMLDSLSGAGQHNHGMVNSGILELLGLPPSSTQQLKTVRGLLRIIGTSSSKYCGHSYRIKKQFRNYLKICTENNVFNGSLLAFNSLNHWTRWLPQFDCMYSNTMLGLKEKNRFVEVVLTAVQLTVHVLLVTHFKLWPTIDYPHCVECSCHVQRRQTWPDHGAAQTEIVINLHDQVSRSHLLSTAALSSHSTC